MKHSLRGRAAALLAICTSVASALSGCAGAGDDAWEQTPTDELTDAIIIKPAPPAPNTIDCEDKSFRGCTECVNNPDLTHIECCNPYLETLGYPCKVINKPSVHTRPTAPVWNPSLHKSAAGLLRSN